MARTRSGRAREAAKVAGETYYATHKPCKHGHPSNRYTSSGLCVECMRQRARDYQLQHPIEAKARWDAYHARNPNAHTEAQQRWRLKNPDKHAHIQAARTAKRKQAMPPWVDKAALRRFYRACPDGCQVDHIVPLCNRRVCGLHVPANLQYLSVTDNKEKRNSFVVNAEGQVIFARIPWREDGNLGLAFNELMDQSPDGSWVVFKDHDCMTTTSRWATQISEAIAFKPDAGAFVAMANRIAAPWQRCGDADSNDMAWHRSYGARRLQTRTLLDISNTRGWGGVLFVINKDVWKRVGGFEHGLGCVDHSIHFKIQAAGLKVWLIEGLYVYHWRHWGEQDPTSIFPKVPNCPCRGAETPPTTRVALP